MLLTDRNLNTAYFCESGDLVLYQHLFLTPYTKYITNINTSTNINTNTNININTSTNINTNTNININTSTNTSTNVSTNRRLLTTLAPSSRQASLGVSGPAAATCFDSFKREWVNYHLNKDLDGGLFPKGKKALWLLPSFPGYPYGERGNSARPQGGGTRKKLKEFCPSSKHIINRKLDILAEKSKGFILNDEFLYWFIGFTEGDGSFVKTSRNELNFVIVQGKANVEILYKIQKSLGFGQVLKQNERVYRYIVRRKIELMLIILLFNGNIVLPSRKAQFAIFLQTYNIRPFSSTIPYSNNKNMPSLYNTWFLGFVEAEGCFSISLLSNSNAFRTRFMVAQKGDINLPVLSTLAVIFQCGIVSGHHKKDNYEYVVSGLLNVVKIYDYFDKYINQFLGIKKISYLKFKALNYELSNRSHLLPNKRPLLVKLSQEINSISRKSK